MFYSVDTRMKLDQLFNAYSRRKGVAASCLRRASCLRFLLYGQRVHGDQTPADLDMRDGDQIDAMYEQCGC